MQRQGAFTLMQRSSIACKLTRARNTPTHEAITWAEHICPDSSMSGTDVGCLARWVRTNLAVCPIAPIAANTLHGHQYVSQCYKPVPHCRTCNHISICMIPRLYACKMCARELCTLAHACRPVQVCIRPLRRRTSRDPSLSDKLNIQNTIAGGELFICWTTREDQAMCARQKGQDRPACTHKLICQLSIAL